MRHLALILGLATVAVAAQQALPATSGNTIQVAARGSFNADPDTATVVFDITGQDAALKRAYALAQAQAEKVRAILRAQGFTPDQAHLGNYNVQPMQDYQTHRITDYTVSATLALDLTDFAKIGPLVDAFAAANVNALRGVNFSLKNMDAAKAAAIADGYRQCQAEAAALAQAAKLEIVGLEHAAVDVSLASQQPIMVRAMAGVGGAAPAPTAEFTPHTIAVSAQITAVYRISEH